MSFANNLASGEFTSLITRFQQAGLEVQQLAQGMLCIRSRRTDDRGQIKPTDRMRLLISVGVHGDETAPIEIMAQLLEELSQEAQSLAVDLMLMVGNLDAIAQAKRFIEADLNRLFTPHRTQFRHTHEAQRADQLMQAAAQFFAGHSNKWHLDLHTAIRPSHYLTFAIVPDEYHASLARWLGSAGVEAMVCNSLSNSATFSAYTSAYLGATSCTVELGQIGELGKNNLNQFAQTKQALATLLRNGWADQSTNHSLPLLFCVTQELIKHSEAFRFTFDDSTTQNFTQFAPHTVLATDGKMTYAVGDEVEYILFPNSAVKVGLRAGVMVIRLK
jgi:succinylglutamate desuccinylase